MENTENKFYMVSYKLYTLDANGEKKMVEEAPLARPYQFVTGMGMVIDAFEAQMNALSQSDNFDFVIPSADAYGDREDEQVATVGREIFEIDGKFDSERIYAGAIVPLVDSEGHQFNATIIEVTPTNVTVDLNHPFAGNDLNFVGQVIEARPATDEEIQGVLSMLSSDGCGCGCGDCEGCSGDEQEDCEGGCCNHKH